MKLLIVVNIVLFLSESGYTQNCGSSVFPPDPTSGCCGHAASDNKIRVSVANIVEYPWMAIVEYQKGDTLALLCGAVLISGRYVLSAASCFSKFAFEQGTPVSIRLGEYDTNNSGPDCAETAGAKDCNDGAISIPIEKFTSYPEYNSNNSRQHDITLIRLARIAPYTDFIRPICLPSSDITIKAPKKLLMTVAGWGAVNKTVTKSNVLRRIHVPYVDYHLCEYQYIQRRITLSKGQLCAGSKNRDSCSGDSGGPLMFSKAKTTELAGIVSFGPTPCGQDIPGVYTKVFAYKDWIQTTMEADKQMSTMPTISTSKTTTITTKTTAIIQAFNSDLIVFRD